GESAALDARDRKPLAEFITHLETERNKIHGVLLGELTSARYLALIRRLQQAKHDLIVVETTITLHDLAKNAFKKLRKAIQLLGPSPNNARLHETRVKTKRARYAAQLAQLGKGNAVTRFIKNTGRAQ